MTENLRPRVLITGGTGFIGTELAKRLDAESYEVVVFDKKNPTKGFPNSVSFVNGDLRDKTKFTGIINDVKPQSVIHMASNIGARGYLEEHADKIIEDNTAMDDSLFASIEESNIRLLFNTSSSMVFENATVYPYQESDLPKIAPPTNLYGQTKLRGERLCKLSKIDHVIVRYHNVYGPDEQPKGEGPGNIHVIPAVIEKVKIGTLPLVILGNPEDARPFTYIDDAVEATVRLLFKGLRGSQKVINQDFNIGPAQTTKIHELYKLAWNLFGDTQPFDFISQEISGSTAHRREMNPKKINSATGWYPNVNLEEGLQLVF